MWSEWRQKYKKYSGGSSILSTKGAMRHVGSLLRGVGALDSEASRWGLGRSPSRANGIFVFLRNETHSTTQKCELLETRGWMSTGPKYKGMGARAPRAVGPHKVGACPYSAANTQWRRGHAPLPCIFNMRKIIFV